MAMPDLLLEIGVEELPARFVPPALAAMEEISARLLAEGRIGHGSIQALGTPRRLALIIRDLAETQESISREVQGPSRKAAFDDKGAPTKAAEGFARGQGVEVGSLVVKANPKGEYMYAVRQEEGKPTRELLPELIIQLIEAIPFQKSMRWGDCPVKFARPIRWLMALSGGEVVPFRYAGIESGNLTRGHRFLAPGSFVVTGPDSYIRQAKAASVIVDHGQRRKKIQEALAKEAKARQGRVLDDEALLEQVTFLVEYPVVTCGSFKEEYLKLPPEVLVTSMKSHQKYFPVVDQEGHLKPLFLTVNNIKAVDMDLIRRGNERVLSARLADAQFFYREDLKEPLAAKVDKLRKVVYQEKLGTSLEKVNRFRALAGHLSRCYGLGDPVVAERAALLCKADLVTEMVGEFPDLQGIMGKYYALESGEPAAVAEAILEHYLPRFAGDSLPVSGAGIAVGLADKLDTIAGSFGIGARPTGSEDPYGLRRLTIGIINIIWERKLELDLPDLIARAVAELGGKIERPVEEVTDEIIDFFRGRLQSMFAQEGFRSDLVEAVLAPGFANLVDVRQRLVSLSAFCSRKEFQPLAVAFKRVGNILPAGWSGTVREDLLQETVEHELQALWREKAEGISQLKVERRYAEVLTELAALRPAVDSFFDGVMVMVEDEPLRTNRLALLRGVADLFASVADFTRIVT